VGQYYSGGDTKRLQTALDTVEVRLLDHLVIGGTDSVSFAERGLI
jgi:DNA repair protein RadC